MAKTNIQKQMTSIVENFIGLWNRYFTLYIEGVAKEDITTEKENELLKFQGTMVEQLIPVLEIEKERFDVHDQVMAVINDLISLDIYTRMSEFQVSRMKRMWHEAMSELEKLYRFCDTYDPKIDKKEKITDVRRRNPYWDPTAGSIRDVLTRIVVAPKTFFQGQKTGVTAERIGTFIFLTFFIPMLIIFTIAFMANFDTAKIVGRNVVIEAGLISSDETGFFPGVLTAGTVFVGLIFVSFAAAIILLILHYILTLFMHMGFKLTSAREEYTDTYKAITYGAAPVIAIITAPYAIVLQIMGASKVHKYPYVLAAIGWLIGMTLYLAVLFTGIGAAFYFTGNIPPIGEEYASVLEDNTVLIEKNARGEEDPLTVDKGEWFTSPEEATLRKTRKHPSLEVYKIEIDDKKYYIDRDNVVVQELTWRGVPEFIFDRIGNSIDEGRDFLDDLIEKYSKDE